MEQSPPTLTLRGRRDYGFTLIELILVIIIVGAMFVLVGRSTGTFSYWKEETFFREVRESITFLHTQSMADQMFYRIEFLKENDTNRWSYRIGAIPPFYAGTACTPDTGFLSCQLAASISPAIPSSYALIPPPSYASLFEPHKFPPDVMLEGIETENSNANSPTTFLDFSPRGGSEQAVIHFSTVRGARFTIAINPFTGTTEFFREHKSFTPLTAKP